METLTNTRFGRVDERLVDGGVYFAARNWRDIDDFLSNDEDVTEVSRFALRVQLGGTLIVAAFLCFVIFVSRVVPDFYPLTRYYVWIWPWSFRSSFPWL